MSKNSVSYRRLKEEEEALAAQKKNPATIPVPEADKSREELLKFKNTGWPAVDEYFKRLDEAAASKAHRR
jgi:hypothetical protein